MLICRLRYVSPTHDLIPLSTAITPRLLRTNIDLVLVPTMIQIPHNVVTRDRTILFKRGPQTIFLPHFLWKRENFQTGERSTKLPPKFIQSQEREIEFHERTKG